MSTLQVTTKTRFVDVQKQVAADFGVTNMMAAPKIDKVVLNMGVGRAIEDGQILNTVADHLTQIAGQRVQITKAKKSIAQFRSRAGMKIGCMATLRGARMWAFLDKLTLSGYSADQGLPWFEPEEGLRQAGQLQPRSDRAGLFPEIDLDRLDQNQGLSISVVIRNSDAEKSLALLKGIGFPFRER